MTNKTTDNSKLFHHPKIEKINLEDYTIRKKEQNKIILKVDIPWQINNLIEALVENYNLTIRKIKENDKECGFEITRYEIEISERE